MSKPIEPVYRLLGARVEQLRGLLGWNQTELALKTGYSRGTIANIETGRQRILLHDLDAFARAFNTSPKNLMKGIWL